MLNAYFKFIDKKLDINNILSNINENYLFNLNTKNRLFNKYIDLKLHTCNQKIKILTLRRIRIKIQVKYLRKQWNWNKKYYVKGFALSFILLRNEVSTLLLGLSFSNCIYYIHAYLYINKYLKEVYRPMSVEPLKERIEKKKNVVYLSKILKIVLSKKTYLRKVRTLFYKFR